MKLWFLMFILAAAMVNGEESKPQSDTHGGKTTNTAQCPENAVGRTIIAVNQPAPQGQEDDHPSKSPNYLHELLLPQNAPTVALVIVGLFGIGTAVWTVRVIARQTKAAENAAETALLNTTAFIHSQRPWISVKTSLGSPLLYDEQGAHITIKVALENVGQMPATGVWIDPAMYVQGVPGKPTAVDERKRMCGEIPKRTQIGWVVFPGQTAVYQYRISAAASNIEASCRAIFGDVAAEAKMYGANIIVAVAYRTTIDKTLCYYTAAIHDLTRIETSAPGAPFALRIGESTPLESLQLSMSGIAGIIAE